MAAWEDTAGRVAFGGRFDRFSSIGELGGEFGADNKLAVPPVAAPAIGVQPLAQSMSLMDTLKRLTRVDSGDVAATYPVREKAVAVPTPQFIADRTDLIGQARDEAVVEVSRAVPVAQSILASQLRSMQKLNTPVGRKPRVERAQPAKIMPKRAKATPKKAAPKKHVWLATRPLVAEQVVAIDLTPRHRVDFSIPARAGALALAQEAALEAAEFARQAA